MRWIAVVVAVSLVWGCAYAGWKIKRKWDGHALPKRVHLYVAISEEVESSNDGGSIAALVDALDTELRERGHEVVIVGAHPSEAPPLPRIELQVLSADWGDRRMRGAGNLVGYAVAPAAMAGSAVGAGSMLVDCYVVQANSQVTFSGRIRAGTFGSDYDGYDTVGAERAGRSIARAVAE